MGADSCPEWSPSWEMSGPLPFVITRLVSFLQAIITAILLSSSFFISPIQLPLNLDQIACSGRFSSPHLAKKTQQEENTLHGLTSGVKSLFFANDLCDGFRESTLALRFLANTQGLNFSFRSESWILPPYFKLFKGQQLELRWIMTSP